MSEEKVVLLEGALDGKVVVDDDEAAASQMANDSNMLIHTASSKIEKAKNKAAREQAASKQAKKKLTRKEKKRLEKVIERKNKSSRRSELLDKLASIQINQNELKLYSSVKDIGKKEKRKHDVVGDDGDALATEAVHMAAAGAMQQQHQQRGLNSIAGANKKKRTEPAANGNDDDDGNKSVDTDDMSSDSEVDEEAIAQALLNFKELEMAKRRAEFERTYRADPIKSDDEDENDATTTTTKQPKPTSTATKQKTNGASAGGVTGHCESSNAAVRATRYVYVERREEIKQSRSKLPIITEEQVIMEKINENDITIICGETGSGKTTQVPQFLYEAGYAEDGLMIGVTEPRRVAAISMSRRINDEMNFGAESSAVVAYQIRYEGNWSATSTRLKFMTDGVLLKEVQTDFLLTKYSAIVIDEAHERSVYTDILIGLLSRIVPLRRKRANPLKLVIMSATLRVEDFTDNRRLFAQVPPVIRVESRQFPVVVHFNKRTPDDYLAEAYKKICQIHRRLPEGGILVFVTGQQEVNVLCHKLRQMFPLKHARSHTNDDAEAVKEDDKEEEAADDDADDDDDDDDELKTRKKLNKTKRIGKKKKQADEATSSQTSITQAPAVDLNSYSLLPRDQQKEEDEKREAAKLSNSNDNDNDDDDGDQLYNLDEVDDLDSGDDDDDDDAIVDDGTEQSTTSEKKTSSSRSSGEKPLYVLPLYSLMASDKQQRVFEPVPTNAGRLCVIATNIAETSLTIPNVKYVIDCGKVKQKLYDKVTGVSTFRIEWTSKASAEQRAGRAGRTAPGHCYRLYSSAVFNDEFARFAEPEIVRKPVEDLVLQMKDLGIDRIVNFPFPTPPTRDSLAAAENLLVQLGALQVAQPPLGADGKPKQQQRNKDQHVATTLTNLGKNMCQFAVNPRYAKMICLASEQQQQQHSTTATAACSDASVIVAYVIALISGLSVPELLMDGETSVEVATPKPSATSTSSKKDDKASASAAGSATSGGGEKQRVKFSQMRQTWIGECGGGVGGVEHHTFMLGDLMLLLVALGAVEYEEQHVSDEARLHTFCAKYGIRYKAAVEARKLRKQLVNAANLVFPHLNLSLAPLTAPPTQEQAKLVRQIVLSGMVDKLAKRYEHAIVDKEDKELKNAYQGLLLEEPIFIHPSSVLFKQLPAYVCYTEMVETSRLYMKGVCGVEARWLPVYLAQQCSFDKAIVATGETPQDAPTSADQTQAHMQPRFDQVHGKVMCHRGCTFGRAMWKIEPVEVEFPESMELYKWFARFFLEGECVQELKTYAKCLLASPTTILKSWARLQPRTETLLNALITNKCFNKARLDAIWADRKDFLLNEYLMWIPESLHFELRLKWPFANNQTSKDNTKDQSTKNSKEAKKSGNKKRK